LLKFLPLDQSSDLIPFPIELNCHLSPRLDLFVDAPVERMPKDRVVLVCDLIGASHNNMHYSSGNDEFVDGLVDALIKLDQVDCCVGVLVAEMRVYCA
jgi:hypothetical protein